MEAIMETLYKQLGERMRTARQTLNITQAKVAETVGIEESFYGQIERGRAVPSVKTLVGIARALKVSAGDLFPDPRKPRRSMQFETLESMLLSISPSDRRLLIDILRMMSERLKR